MAGDKQPKILVVDDRTENLVAMTKVLSGLDAHIVQASSGNEALYQTLESEFALVLLDVQMPEMDGFEVASLIREREATRYLPIIFVTAIDKNRQNAFKGYEAGAVDFLFKPIDPDILRSKVKVFLELHRYRALLEERNRELSEFARVVAHDLKSPLNTICGYIDRLPSAIERKRQELIESSGERITRGARHMSELIDGLLEYALIGREERTCELVNLTELAEFVVAMLEGPIRDCGATVEIGSLPVVYGDRGELSRLIQNLVANAIKFRVERAPKVRIDCCRDGLRWILSVEDNGIGIDPEYREMIFAPLKRLHTKKEYEGSGLGLAACKKIVENHSGEIWVESVKGEGSKFCFTLPVEEMDLVGVGAQNDDAGRGVVDSPTGV